MPSTPQRTPQNIWPLGMITLTHGVPVSILSNVGIQDAGSSVSLQAPAGKVYGSLCDQLIFSCPSANTGDVFVQYGNFPAPDINRTMEAVPKGQTVALPQSSQLQSGHIDLSQIYVDGTTNDVVYVTAIGGN